MPVVSGWVEGGGCGLALRSGTPKAPGEGGIPPNYDDQPIIQPTDPITVRVGKTKHNTEQTNRLFVLE